MPFEILGLSWRSLMANRFRTVLTMLGLSVGIFVITAIFTFVDSMYNEVESNLARLGDRVIYVHKYPWTMSEDKDWHKISQRRKVRYADYLKLKRNLVSADAVTFEVSKSGVSANYLNREITGAELVGITEDYGRINRLDILTGRVLSELEINAGRPVCIVGNAIGKKLFPEGIPDELPTITVAGKKALLVGVIDRMGGDMFGTSEDEKIYIPYGFMRKIYKEVGEGLQQIIAIQATSRDDVPLVEGEAIGIMRRSRGLRPKNEDDFSINKPENLMNEIDELANKVYIGGLVISIFSILVGGFGIGNIMFTSVKERTFEIGLQKALGATRSFILFQFLTEALLICLLGGLVGLLFTIGGGKLLQIGLESMEISMKIVTSNFSIGFAIVISVITGVLSGVVPSILASRLDPVESMRA